jgi:hypothetical protein
MSIRTAVLHRPMLSIPIGRRRFIRRDSRWRHDLFSKVLSGGGGYDNDDGGVVQRCESWVNVPPVPSSSLIAVNGRTPYRLSLPCPRGQSKTPKTQNINP